MKTKLITVAILLVSLTAFSQVTKKELLYELESYATTQTFNKAYDVEYKTVFNAIKVVGNMEYSNMSKESESRGYADFYQEDDTRKESMSIEVVGDAKPYRVTFSVKFEQREKKLDGTYGAWQPVNRNTSDYMKKLHRELYTTIYGSLEYPEELLKKIEDFNGTQTKDRRKVLKGKDY